MSAARYSCLGPKGSYSELAALRFSDGEGEIVLCPDFYTAVSALQKGEADFAVLPIENSIQGGVLKNLDLLEHPDAPFAVEELVLAIDHRLATLEGVSCDAIERIYSHEQAIGQCSEYLRTHFAGAKLLYTRSTAESLEKLDAHSAGIVGAHAKKQGVVLSQENIADEKRNFTRFLRLVRREEAHPKRSEKVFFCAICKHRPGSLYELLGVFARHGINLTRIESRPIRDVFGEYRFFIEIDGDIAREEVRTALKEAEAFCRQFHIIGAY